MLSLKTKKTLPLTQLGIGSYLQPLPTSATYNQAKISDQEKREVIRRSPGCCLVGLGVTSGQASEPPCAAGSVTGVVTITTAPSSALLLSREDPLQLSNCITHDFPAKTAFAKHPPSPRLTRPSPQLTCCPKPDPTHPVFGPMLKNQEVSQTPNVRLL